MSFPRLLTDVLAASVARDPAAPAVEGSESFYTYLELDAASSKIASHLVRSGIRPGDRVAMMLRKSPETIAALFGILRAGAVMVPMDRSAPGPRLAAIARNSGVRALIGSGTKLDEVAAALEGEAAPATVIAGHKEVGAAAAVRPGILPWEEVLAGPALREVVAREPDDLAYLLYTSGSTGIPKGVMITHRNALAFTSWAMERFGVRPGDRVASVAPLHFDLSTFDIYTTLEAGATIELVPDDVALFPSALASHLETKGVTIAYLTPSTLTGMLLRGRFGERPMPALRMILFAGEVFPPRYLSDLMRRFPGLPLFNLYGPTETNVCTYYGVLPEDEDRDRPVPIGIPASGDVAFAVDENERPITEPGVEGELLVAGPTVAAGYWGAPEATARTFLPGHPLAPPGMRVYRTGDRVSLDAAGRWLYHGRKDLMVKSRGYRIELGDIDSALTSHPDVTEAAAVAIPDEEIGSRIKACVVLRPGASADAAAILRHLAERLPRYMVPGSIELHAALPKTSSGKIDRVRLATESA